MPYLAGPLFHTAVEVEKLPVRVEPGLPGIETAIGDGDAPAILEGVDENASKVVGEVF
jgi:hypothetical protein